MKRKAICSLSFVFFLSFFLVACGSDEPSTSSADEQETEQPEAEENEAVEDKADEEEEKTTSSWSFATTYEEILEEKPGTYSGNIYNKAVINRDLDENSFHDMDSFQVYDYLLEQLSEAAEYKEFYDYLQNVNGTIETEVTEMPGGMLLETGEVVETTTNIAILLDASKSMDQMIAGKSKMDMAKDAIRDFLTSMPEDANVSLRVYGHEGSNTQEDYELSCSQTEMIYDFNPYHHDQFSQSLEGIEPSGWTPIAKAIEETKKDFEAANLQGQNLVYVVSDGIETCGEDPVEAARDLHHSNIKAVVNIIGFDVDNTGQKQLKEVAEAGGGEFKTVRTADDFKRLWDRERTRLYNEWSKWAADNYNSVSREQSNKLNELYKKRSDLQNLYYKERSRLNDAIDYLRRQEQISNSVRDELRSLVKQRTDILEDFVDEYRSVIDQLDEEGDALKRAINEKGDEMKKKYRRS